LSDPDDELVIDLAAQRRAIIVTYNKRDFSGVSSMGIDVMSPGDFLAGLRKA